MLKLISILFLLITALNSTPAESCAFRIEGGDLIRCGMTKIEVQRKIGNPDLRDRQIIAVDTGYGRGGQSAEAWSYIVRGDIGGDYYLTVMFSGNKVVDIESKQVER